ncbi:hypothetical protein NDU88_005142 [Pleurodeles waltl]|uniref:Uncharacterized protein n=1 Tax=Pleurodeles waltl TaxID=8319 RepID=A0AAV7SKU3_PLEWA|nr:hypothetical protein NDU88_005142 [Pleurodeles waltl]
MSQRAPSVPAALQWALGSPSTSSRAPAIRFGTRLGAAHPSGRSENGIPAAASPAPGASGVAPVTPKRGSGPRRPLSAEQSTAAASGTCHGPQPRLSFSAGRTTPPDATAPPSSPAHVKAVPRSVNQLGREGLPQATSLPVGTGSPDAGRLTR